MCRRAPSNWCSIQVGVDWGITDYYTEIIINKLTDGWD